MADPTPTPSPTPEPTPTPAPTPTPTPSPTPSPTPTPTPVPTPTPDPSEDWRTPWSLGDAGKLAKLQRYNSPADLAKAHWSAVDKVLEGAKREPLPENPTPEQLATYRQANGIPDKPEGYEGALKLDDGLVLGTEDKALLGEFFKEAHAANANPADVNRFVNWYFKTAEASLEARAQQDQDATDAAEASLRNEWGAEFKKNMGISFAFLNRLPESVRDLVKHGRLSDGTPIFANAEIVKAFAAFERDINPMASALPGGSGDQLANAEAKIAEYEKKMRDDPKGWSRDNQSQQHYMQLIDARANEQARRGARAA